jgi:GntR family transcriptional regulator, rspAB operon transcriptional repressor
MPPRNGLPPSLIELDPAVTRPAALPDRIYATLKHRMLTCAVLPGARVLERDLCTEMLVSRTPLREALNRLALEGLVAIAPYRGYAVAPLTIVGFRELCEVRQILESEAAAWTAGPRRPSTRRSSKRSASALPPGRERSWFFTSREPRIGL